MEVVFLFEGTTARGQGECRSIASIRNTETGLNVRHCATVGDIGTTGA